MVRGSRYPAVKRALTNRTTGPTQDQMPVPEDRAPEARYHLLTKPLAGGMPIRARDAMV